jgi:NAD(P)-dependent dehydrogenase (short-subunit alcohol dehydrogenase family)
MTGGLDKKTAVVTGASRGIGRSIAQALAKEGAAVALISRSESKLEETRALIETAGGRAVVFPGDVSKRQDVERIMSEIAGRCGRIDILCNNAGVYTAVGPVGEDDPKAWWFDMTVNLYGVYLCCHYAMPHMSSPATIVNTASGAGIKPSPYATAYSCSKAAVILFTESLAAELKSRDIAVFSIRPGAVKTDIIKILSTPLGQRYLGDNAKIFEEGSELLCPPERAAELVVRLCRPEAARLTGRFVSVADDLDRLIEEAGGIAERQQHVLRVQSRSGIVV